MPARLIKCVTGVEGPGPVTQPVFCAVVLWCAAEQDVSQWRARACSGSVHGGACSLSSHDAHSSGTRARSGMHRTCVTRDTGHSRKRLPPVIASDATATKRSRHERYSVSELTCHKSQNSEAPLGLLMLPTPRPGAGRRLDVSTRGPSTSNL
eukprot:6580411-Prymnesium_polylepis.1